MSTLNKPINTMSEEEVSMEKEMRNEEKEMENETKDTELFVSTFSLHKRHKQYLKAIKRHEGQSSSDTVRRALDEYKLRHPVPEGGEKDEKRGN